MISKLHYITQDAEGKSHQQLAKEACEAAAQWIQLRVKNKSYSEWKIIAEETLRICKEHGVKLIINDNVRLALELSADGVHLGKEDMSTAEARKILGEKFIIGGTAYTFEDIKKHVQTGVNYVGVGPFRFTKTKEKLSPVLGLDGYKKIMERCAAENISVPVIAIGGITASDIPEVIGTGVYGVAVASEITFSENKREKIRQLYDQLKMTLAT